MSIRFAAPHIPGGGPVCMPIARAMFRRAEGRAANDNGSTTPSDSILRAALRHFAEHGLGAARAARQQAEQAFFEGDRQAYDWWIGICQTLDRRLAAEAHDKITESHDIANP